MKYMWYMRGGLTLNEVYQMPPGDREIIDTIVKENIEITKKSNLPLL